MRVSEVIFFSSPKRTPLNLETNFNSLIGDPCTGFTFG